jgi:hypothetical protein
MNNLIHSVTHFPLSSALGMNPGGFPLIQHVGIVTGYDATGMPLVTHNSYRRGGTYTETLAEFADGQSVRILPWPRNVPIHETIRRAQEKAGTRWSLFGWNCEHFARYALGLDVESGQLKAAVSLGALALGLGAVAAFAD